MASKIIENIRAASSGYCTEAVDLRMQKYNSISLPAKIFLFRQENELFRMNTDIKNTDAESWGALL
ncbi:MAG: hypothetical protein NTV88_00030 [Candidatus Micrarchaeota archaeon]|nr:hypothetical protein [Candidatus Micrarchaeota archaeon]